MVERFFRSISADRLKRGVFRSVPELITAIEEYIAVHNKNPKPFVWTAKANDILQKVIRGGCPRFCVNGKSFNVAAYAHRTG